MLETLSTNKMKKKRIGRGGSRGNTAGRGHKGQKSRAGRNIRPAMRDEIQRIPKRRGHSKNRARGVNTGKKTQTITLTTLQKNFKAGDSVGISALIQKRLITRGKSGITKVKIVSRGEITIPLVIKKQCHLSEKAKEDIIKAGGRVQ